MQERLIHPNLGERRLERLGSDPGLHPAIPIILGHVVMPLHDVAGDISFSKVVDDRLAAFGFGLEQAISHLTVRRAGAGLQIVINNVIQAHMIAAIDGPVTVIEEHIVDEGEVAIHAHAGIPPRIAGPEIAQERAVQAADGGPERMMENIERFRRDRVLDGDVDGGQLEVLASSRGMIHVAIHGDVLVQAPRGGHVIDDEVAHRIASERIVAVRRLGLAAAKTHVPDDDIMGVQLHGVARDADAVAGSGVARDGDVGRADADGGFQANDARDVEDDDARPALLTGVAKASRPAVVQVRDDKDFAAATAERIHPAAPGAGKCGNFSLRQIPGLGGAGKVGLALGRPLLDYRQRALKGFIGQITCRRPLGPGRLHDIRRHLRIALGASGESQGPR